MTEQDMIDDYAIPHKLWTMAIDFKSLSEEWTNVKPLASLSSEETVSTVDGWFRALSINRLRTASRALFWNQLCRLYALLTP